MRFGYFAALAQEDPGETVGQIYRDTIEQVECAEDAGFDIVWFPERHFNQSAAAPHPLFNVIDAARRTKRVKLGPSVLVAPYRHPLLLAEEIGMVDQMTDGRLEIAMARGASLFQYERFGISDAEAAGRMNECMRILLGIWREDADFAFEGEHYRFPPTYVVPRPLQAPHPPLWLAARSPDSIRFCIENGIGFHTTPLRQPKSASVTTMQTIHSILQEYPDLKRPGVAIQSETFVSRDEAAIARSMKHLERSHIRNRNFGRNGRLPVMGFGQLDPLPEGMHLGAAQLAENCVVGSPESVVDQVRWFQDLGADEFIAHIDFGQPQRDILQAIELFGKEVIARDWTPRQPAAGDGPATGDAAERRRTLLARCEQRFGTGWQAWGEADWLSYFERSRTPGTGLQHELFDIGVTPGVKADSTGLVGRDGRLMLFRDLKCPECGRPAYALVPRDGHQPVPELHKLVAEVPELRAWHPRHA